MLRLTAVPCSADPCRGSPWDGRTALSIPRPTANHFYKPGGKKVPPKTQGWPSSEQLTAAKGRGAQPSYPTTWTGVGQVLPEPCAFSEAGKGVHQMAASARSVNCSPFGVPTDPKTRLPYVSEHVNEWRLMNTGLPNRPCWVLML